MTGAPTTVARSLWSSLTANLPLKLFSLALSIGLFSIVHSDQDAQRAIFLDVVALLPPADSDQLLLTELPHEVKVTLRGGRSQINALSRNEFSPIQMDLTDPGRRFFYFDPAAVDVPGNVRVVEISPATISLHWARRTERRVAVKARFDGHLPEGMSLIEPVVVAPNEVVIRGPVDLVASIDEAQTDLVSLSGLGVGDHDVRVPLSPLPQHVSYDGEASVQLRLVVEEEILEETLNRLAVAVVGEGEAQVRPAAVNVTLRGPANRLAAVDPQGVVPYVEIGPEIRPGTHPYEVAVRGDLEGIEVVRVAPKSVLVRVRSTGNRSSAASTGEAGNAQPASGERNESQGLVKPPAAKPATTAGAIQASPASSGTRPAGSGAATPASSNR